MEKILVLGATGLVGSAVFTELSKEYQVFGTFNNQEVSDQRYFKLDVNVIETLMPILETVKPDRVIYCLRGDFEKEKILLKSVVEYLQESGGRLYFCSTANVFDGDTTKAHYPQDMVNSVSDYGRFKIECEKLILEELGDRAVIMRLPMIWGRKSPRLDALKASIEKGVEVYVDLFLNNNVDVVLAKQIMKIIKMNLHGIFHLGSKEIINHKAFIKLILDKMGAKDYSFKDERLSQDKYCFAVLPDRQEALGNDFYPTNEELIEHLF